MKPSPSNFLVNQRYWSQILLWPFSIGRASSLLLVFSMFAVVQAVSFAATPNGPALDATRTEYALRINAPVIDGEINVLDPDEWRFAAGNSDYWQVFPDAVLAADGIRGGALGFGTAPADRDDLSFKIFAGFDSNYLYVAVRVRDSAIQNDSAAADSANGNTLEDDSVEVFVDGANANAPTWAAGQSGGQFVITANNAYREANAGNPGYGPNAAWYAKTAPLADGTGYEAEFRISLATLGNPKPGDVLGFTVAVNDDDDGGTRDRQLIWVGTAHQPVTYGNLVLGAQSYTAVKVTTPPNPDGKINLNEYSGAAEVRVNAKIGVVYIPGADDDLPVTDLEYKAYAVHDNDAVYFAIDVTDDKISTDTAGEEQKPGLTTWDDDSIELFFDLDNSKGFGGASVLGNGVFEGQYTLTPIGTYFDGSPSADAQKGVHWFAGASLTPTGYQVEFKIPKSSLGITQDNTSVGFHIAINDDDVVADYSHIGWTGQAHHEYTYGTLTLAGSSPPTSFQTVSVNFQGRMGPPATNTPPLAPTDVAGVVAVGNWNNVPDLDLGTAPYEGSPTGALVDSAGAPTTVTLTFDANGGWNNEATSVTTGDAKMMFGFIKASFGGGDTGLETGKSGIFTFNNVPEGQYDVYVYTATDADNLAYNISDKNNITTYYARSIHRFNDGAAFVQAKNTNPTGTRDTGSYVKFSNLATSGSGTIGFTATPISGGAGFAGVGIAGIQLVKSGAAAPTVSVARTAAGTGITLTFTGRLYEANTVTGPYTLVPGNPQGTFNVLFTAGTTKFYQAGP